MTPDNIPGGGGGGGGFCSVLLDFTSMQGTSGEIRYPRFLLVLKNTFEALAKEIKVGDEKFTLSATTQGDLLQYKRGAFLFVDTPSSTNHFCMCKCYTGYDGEDETAGTGGEVNWGVAGSSSKSVFGIFARKGTPGVDGSATLRQPHARRCTHAFNAEVQKHRLCCLQGGIKVFDCSQTPSSINNDNYSAYPTNTKTRVGCGGAGCRPTFLQNAVNGAKGFPGVNAGEAGGWGAGGVGGDPLPTRGGNSFAVIYW